MSTLYLAVAVCLVAGVLLATGVDAEEDEEEEGEAPERRAPVTEEGQGDPNHGDEPQHHPDIDEEMEEEDRGHTIAIDPPELRHLALGECDDA
jgi:hypothetical protein